MEQALKRIKVARRVVIAEKPGRYLAFPDVVRTVSGKLLCAFREADIHYPAREQETWLQLCCSSDQGTTWSSPQPFPHEPHGKDSYAWHCPRLTLLTDGRIALTCDRTNRNGVPEAYVSFSSDEGTTWSDPIATGARGILPDRLIELGNNEFLFSVHWNDPVTHALAQILYASTDGGNTWQQRAVIASDKDYNFCEGSIVHLGGKKLICYLRENSFAHHPTFATTSHDAGQTWSTPVAHPTHAHRPCAGLLDDNTVLLTYRDVSANPGLVAWTGTTTEFGYAPALRNLNCRSIATSVDGLQFSTQGSSLEGVELMLFSLKNWNQQFQLDARIKCLESDDWGCIMAGAGFLRITPRKVSFIHYPDETRPNHYVCFGESAISPGDTHQYSLCYAKRTITVWVNGVRIISGTIGERPLPWQKKLSIGNSFPGEPWLVRYDRHHTQSIWNDLQLSVRDSGEEIYNWSWTNASTMLPNSYERKRVMRISEETSGDLYEAGYSGWTPLNAAQVYCVNYERNDTAKPFIVGYLLELY